jgi:hypothetical protein
MAKRSERNRHTGRVNDMKAVVLESGKQHTDSRGRIYRTIQTGIVRPRPGHPGVPVAKTLTVRDFDAERARATAT